MSYYNYANSQNVVQQSCSYYKNEDYRDIKQFITIKCEIPYSHYDTSVFPSVYLSLPSITLSFLIITFKISTSFSKPFSFTSSFVSQPFLLSPPRRYNAIITCITIHLLHRFSSSSCFSLLSVHLYYCSLILTCVVVVVTTTNVLLLLLLLKRQH